jgi:hypothetical protein
LIGTLAAAGEVSPKTLRTAMTHATVTAAYTCEAFGVDRLVTLKPSDIQQRSAAFRRMIAV